MDRDLLSIDDLSSRELGQLLELSAKVKAQPGDYADRLAGRSVAMIFEKTSTRTGVSFGIPVPSTGGHPVPLSSADLQLGRGETIEDTGRVLSRYVQAIVLRTFEQERLEVLASAASVPVVNALSDFEHPCQCLADLLTIKEVKGELAGTIVTYLGDGNNVTHSLLFGGAKAGMHGRAAPPRVWERIPQVVQRASDIAAETGGSVTITHDPIEASRGADVLYTDVWASMGQEAESDERALVFPAYEPDAEKVAAAAPDVTVLHCLPAHRGQEIAADVIDGPHSVVWDQAENRMHAQKALVLWLPGLAGARSGRTRRGASERPRRGRADRIRRPPVDPDRRPLQAALVREGRSGGGGLPDRPGHDGPDGDPEDPERGQVDRREDRGVRPDGLARGARRAARADPAGGSRDDRDPGPGSEEGAPAPPRPRDRGRRAARPGGGAGPPGRGERVRRQDRGEHPPRHRAHEPVDGSGARVGRHGPRGPLHREARFPKGCAPDPVRGLPTADGRDDRRPRPPRRERRRGGGDGGVHDGRDDRSRARERRHEVVDPDTQGPTGRPSRRPARGVGRRDDLLHRLEGPQHPDPRDGRPQGSQAERVRPVPGEVGQAHRGGDRGGGLRETLAPVDPAHAARGSRRSTRSAGGEEHP